MKAILSCLLLALPALSQPVVVSDYLGPPLWRWEGNGSRWSASNTADGPSIQFVIDILGPSYLYVSIDPLPGGHVNVTARQSGTTYICEASYFSWDEMLAARGEAAIWVRACFDRAGVVGQSESGLATFWGLEADRQFQAYRQLIRGSGVK